MANLNNFMFKVKDYNKNKSNNIVNSNITFNEYADKWLKEYRLQIRKLDLPIVINNINIGKYYFGQKRLKDITSLDYQQFLMNYSLGRKKSSVEQANSIIQRFQTTFQRLSCRICQNLALKIDRKSVV